MFFPRDSLLFGFTQLINHGQAAYELCPSLSVTTAGLVRHVGMMHRAESVEAINTAFGGAKVFAKCPHCPIRFLASGTRTHISAKHPGVALHLFQRVPARPAKVLPPPPAPYPGDQEIDMIVPLPLVPEVGVVPAPWDYGDYAEVAPVPPVPELEEYGTLVARFRKGAFYKHHTWRAPLGSIMARLLKDAVSNTEAIAPAYSSHICYLPDDSIYRNATERRKRSEWIYFPLFYLLK